jgi:HAD superfamily hydrolase (TIGR01509 family)
MDVRAVLFDLDGTLVEFRVDYVQGRKLILDFARRMGYDMEGQTEERSMHDIIDHYRRIGQPEAHRAVKKFAYDLMERLEVQGAAETRPFPDSIPVLKRLKGDGVKTAVVTNSCRRAVELVFERYPLRQYIDAVTTRDDVDVIKPDPGIVEHALRLVGVTGRESVFVGDAPGDILAAKAVGSVSVGIPRGFASSGQLLEARPDYIIYTLEALPELLQRLKVEERR